MSPQYRAKLEREIEVLRARQGRLRKDGHPGCDICAKRILRIEQLLAKEETK